MDSQEKAFEKLINNSVSLYTEGILCQYGLTDKQALEIVSNLTTIPKNKLKALKKQRDKSIKESMDFSNIFPILF